MAASGSSCAITVDVEPRVAVGNSPNIVWTIVDKTGVGYKFPANGIQFNNKADPVPPGEFDPMLVQAAGSRFMAKDHHRAKGKFNYQVTVVKPDGSPGCTLDPVVYND